MDIQQFLRREGPCLSSVLSEKLQQTGMSSEAARQRVSRAGDPVRRLAGLIFPKNARFLYHADDFNTQKYWTALVRDIGIASPAYGAAVAAMQLRGGIVPRSHFNIVSGSPVRQKGQLASEAVFDRLTTVQLLRVTEIDGIGPCVALDANGRLPVNGDDRLKARLLTEKILLLAVKDWARKLNAASADSIVLRDDYGGPSQVGPFVWDLAAPSYLRPLVQWKAGQKPKQGFFVCDVAAGGIADEHAVAAFLRKCQLYSGLKRLPTLLPMMIADRFSRKGFALGRSHGLMMATPATLFGREVAEGLASLLHTMSKAAAVAVGKPEVIGELFNSLGQIEGAIGNLRGAFFEMIVGHCTVKNDDGSIDIRKKIVDPETGARAEIDVFRVKEDREVWSYECKAHQPGEIVTQSEIEEWLSDRVSLIHRINRREPRFQNVDFHYEFWTCGKFAPDAVAYLNEISARTRKYHIGWKDGDAVRSYLARLKGKGLLDVFDQQYRKHPLAKLEERHSAESVLADTIADATGPLVLDDADDL